MLRLVRGGLQPVRRIDQGLGLRERANRRRVDARGVFQNALGVVERVQLSQHGAAAASRAAGKQPVRVEEVALDGDAVREHVLVERHRARGGGVLAHERLAEDVGHDVLDVVVVRHQRKR